MGLIKWNIFYDLLIYLIKLRRARFRSQIIYVEWALCSQVELALSMDGIKLKQNEWEIKRCEMKGEGLELEQTVGSMNLGKQEFQNTLALFISPRLNQYLIRHMYGIVMSASVVSG